MSESLVTWNWACAFLHLAQGIAAIYLTTSELQNAKDFRVPLITHYAVWDEKTGPKDATQHVAVLHFALITCAVPFISFFAHLFMGYSAYNDFSESGWYKRNLNNLQSPYRWLEYSISSTLMFFLIALLFSIYDLNILILLMTLNVVIMLMGYLMERDNINNVNSFKINISWIMFMIGATLALIQWAIVFSTLTTTDDDMPALIWAVIFVYLFLFSVFPINMWNFYYSLTNYEQHDNFLLNSLFVFFVKPFTAITKLFVETNNNYASKDQVKKLYLETEKRYMILSLTSKSFLLWLILFGVNQPSTYTLGNN